MFFFGFTIVESNATSLIPWLILSLSSLYIFASHGIVDYGKGVAILIGMACGGYFGAHVAIERGDLWVKRFFSVVVTISAIKLLFF
ncbi:hypothetical protein A3G67_01790 [Candidatus Roizmanbacteria bacterium RIFCSPLOWO2_12_FULL_40_12]|nr:MAG: hypothetical protein A2W49_03990 [Candidatus Roizmanbacteria bacterium RIFCSPHIGHO2_12_41_18]OGK59511.1 MAG: hypothetical protein A3H84_03020 [Candidatus Roizmanbacteria bacterium RIFCSPLOWO2_02_FULL_40_13]OGK61438.1 MAG: hypothetical protein A3G67_01790 [Candidatus Roizmanbacteria bacterium RIFCSPLOWO2_12_FULL_40_12]